MPPFALLSRPLHCSPVCCKGKSTYRSVTELLPRHNIGQIIYVSQCMSKKLSRAAQDEVCSSHTGGRILNSLFVLSVVSQSLTFPADDAHHHSPTFHMDSFPNSMPFLGEPDSNSGDFIRADLLGLLKATDGRTLWFT